MTAQCEMVQPLDEIGGILAIAREREVLTQLAITSRKLWIGERWRGLALVHVEDAEAWCATQGSDVPTSGQRHPAMV